MDTFGSLYKYECKKIWDKKLVKIFFIISLILIIVSGTVRLFGKYVVDGEVVGTVYDEIHIDQSYNKALNGRKIDQQLLSEMSTAYRKIPYTPQELYINKPEYQKYARPYSAIFNFVVNSTKLTPNDIFLNWKPSEQDFYSQRELWLKNNLEKLKLSEGEINFWLKRESKIEKPFVFQESEAYNQMFSLFQTIGFLVILFLSVALSDIFSREHSQRTDQLLLSSPKGRNNLYWVKIFTGVSYAVSSTIICFAIISILTFLLYGTDGFNAAFQFNYISNSDPLTCGQALLIAYVNMLITAVLISVVITVMSEVFNSSIAPLAISSGLSILFMMIAVPEHYRNLSQILSWFPWCYLSPWNIFGKYTLSIFGTYLTPWQAVPIIYLILTIVIALIGKFVYNQYQINGR